MSHSIFVFAALRPSTIFQAGLLAQTRAQLPSHSQEHLGLLLPLLQSVWYLCICHLNLIFLCQHLFQSVLCGRQRDTLAGWDALTELNQRQKSWGSQQENISPTFPACVSDQIHKPRGAAGEGKIVLSPADPALSPLSTITIQEKQGIMAQTLNSPNLRLHISAGFVQMGQM